MDNTLISTIALISLLAAVSPGPDFVIVTKNCLSGNFRAGALTALGVTAALFIHVAYSVLGIAVVIAESPILFISLKYLGALYLLYLGIQLLREKRPTSPEGLAQRASIEKNRNAFVAGFLCNVLNPKATLFILSLFTQFINPSMSLLNKIFAASIFPLVVFVWFVLLSYLITHRLLQKHFSRFQFVITKIMGIVLCGLSFYIILTEFLNKK